MLNNSLHSWLKRTLKDRANLIVAPFVPQKKPSNVPFIPDTTLERIAHMARRSGGRQARKALRSAPLAENIKPVHPGEQGGAYKPLSEKDISAIEENIFRILAEVGFNQATPHCIEACTSVGAMLGEDGRLRFQREVVEATLAKTDRNLVLYGQDPKHDLQLADHVSISQLRVPP